MINFENTQDAFAYKSMPELKRAIFIFKLFKRPFLSSVLQSLLRIALFLRIPVGWAVKPTVYGHFVGGKNLQDCDPVIQRMSQYGVESILDYSVESGGSLEAINHAMKETKASIQFSASKDSIPFAVFKPSAMTFEWVLEGEKRENYQEEVEMFRQRLFELFQLASKHDIPILVDAEEVSWQALIDEVVEEGMAHFNQSKAIVFQTLQMYRTDRIEYLQRVIDDARKGKYFLGIKLVRGAYMEKERAFARKKGLLSPIHPTKEETDRAYNKALEICVQHIDVVSVFNGTHNQESCQLLAELMDKKQLEKNDKNVYFVQLYGMSDNLSFALAKAGYRVAKYVPYGPVKHVMPYLMRRAEENSSVSEQAAGELKMLKQELKRRKN